MAAARAEIHSRPRLRRRHRAKPLRHQSSPTHASDTFQQVAERRSNSTRSDEPLIHYHRAGEFVFLGKQNRVLVQSGLSNTASCSFGAYPHVRFGSLADARVLIETLAVALQPAAQFRQRLYVPCLKLDAPANTANARPSSPVWGRLQRLLRSLAEGNRRRIAEVGS